MKRSVITSLRDIMPDRPLTDREARSVAERQALRFLQLVGADYPCFDEAVITELPRVEVRKHRLWPTSGATQWINGRWVIVIKSSEPVGRQKLSLAHELKHIIDHPKAKTAYQNIPSTYRHWFIEKQICDYFAGCLLMPRPWLKRAWTTQTQELDRLAALFGVTEAAMATRLSQVGLVDPSPRCAPIERDWGLSDSGRFRYRRAADPIYAPSLGAAA